MNQIKIIQGGMGIGVSNWKLASAVSQTGQLGVVSAVAIDEVVVRRLQSGDPGGYYRKAMSFFPIKEIGKRIIDRFFKEQPSRSFIDIGRQSNDMTQDREDIIVASGFAEVFLAKQGHNGLIGVNLMEKIQSDCLPLLYGCMLAGVDFVLMGAGIPKYIPGALDRLSQNLFTTLKQHVTGATPTDDYKFSFNPERFEQEKPLKCPKFIAVISSTIVALTLAKKASGKVDGFVIETNRAAGHNAPPRTTKNLNIKGEPIYGEKDKVDLEKIKELEIPFWLAGGYAIKGKLEEALALGACGIQVGTPFMMCEESGVLPEYKQAIYDSGMEVITDPKASPTGFPFKVIQVEGTMSEKKVYEERPRVCNLGYLREWYKKPDGSLGSRCASEPVKAYVAKGGDIEDTQCRKCLCNALMSNVGLPTSYNTGYIEKPLLTAGDTMKEIDYIKPGMKAKEVIRILLESSKQNR